MRIMTSPIACFLAMLMMSATSLESTASEGGNPRTSPAAPYPASPIIGQVVFDWSTHEQRAPGSDNWPVTWADDGNQYTAWGDGGGFGGTNSNGRVKLGVARIEGKADSYVGKNVWGGKNAENPHQFEGKSYGMLCVDGLLFMWVAHQPNPLQHACQLAWSKNHGATWRLVDWKFCTEHSETSSGNLGIFDAPEPWGPWTTVAYETAWGSGHIEPSTFYWNFSNKWLSADGLRFTLIFTGINSNDAWHTMKGHFVLAEP